MTTSRPLMPFFFPVVAGVGLLGPVAAVGFYELARRRESGRADHTGSTSSTCASAPRSDDMGIVAGLLLLIFFGWLIAAGALYVAAVRLGDADLDRRIPRRRSSPTPRGWALIIAGAVVGAIFGWVVLALSVVSMPLLVDRDVSAARGGFRLLARGPSQQGRDAPLGRDRRSACWCSARSRCSSASPSCCRGSAIRPGTSTRG